MFSRVLLILPLSTFRLRSEIIPQHLTHGNLLEVPREVLLPPKLFFPKRCKRRALFAGWDSSGQTTAGAMGCPEVRPGPPMSYHSKKAGCSLCRTRCVACLESLRSSLVLRVNATTVCPSPPVLAANA